ncbi:MAG: thrombospondin type 3 repeat-containing protein [Crocinitomicaceae bacterium]
MQAWTNGDCDGDGVTNGDELTDGTNPLDPCSFVVASQTVAPSADGMQQTVMVTV